MRRVDASRWHAAETEEAYSRILYALRSGGRVEPTSSPFGLVGDRGDMAGLPVPHRQPLRGSTVRNVDLSGAVFRDNWIEDCLFENVVFDRADLRGIKDHRNVFKDCSFVRTDFRAAGLGHRASAYQRCVFERASFRRTVFSNAEFDDCAFSNCLLDGVDFHASSFINCAFRGKLRDVWFRGGFRLPSYVDERGEPRPNRMKNVSFADASLWEMTFSDHCDLSSVVLPTVGHYMLLDNWAARLAHLAERAEAWPTDEKTMAMRFAQARMGHARKQEWFLLNCDEVLDKWGKTLGTKIVGALSSLDSQE